MIYPSDIPLCCISLAVAPLSGTGVSGTNYLEGFDMTKVLLVLSIVVASSALAQDSSSSSSSSSVLQPTDSANTLVAQGVLGDTDSKHRSPELRVRPEVLEDRVRLLADAYVPHGELEDHPIQFDFFINRKLFASQVKSTTLPGAVGVDIGPDVAVPPFNYTVVAKVIHPNRTFTTMIEGAVRSAEPSSQIFESCTATLVTEVGEDEDIEMFVDNAVPVGESNAEIVDFSFTARKSDNSEEATFALTGTIEGTQASVTATVTRDDTPTVYNLTGTAAVAEGRVEELDLSSEDGDLDISCS